MSFTMWVIWCCLSVLNIKILSYFFNQLINKVCILVTYQKFWHPNLVMTWSNKNIAAVTVVQSMIGVAAPT